MSASPTPKRLVLNLLRAAQGGPLSTREAITACTLFGIQESNVRVALVRLSAAGLIEAEGRGSYRLGAQAGPLAEDVSHWHSAEARVCDWDGGWLMVSTGGLGRSDRPALRARDRALALAGFQELEPTLFLRPDNLVGHAAGVRERLLKLGLDEGAPVFSARDLDPRRERLARQLWDGAALNASYQAGRKKLEQWMKRADRFELDVAARECFLLGNEAIRQLVFDPLLPEPLVNVAARREFTEVVRAFDQLGHTIWQRLLSQVNPQERPQRGTPARVGAGVRLQPSAPRTSRATGRVN
jgi:phenylacetic acid degradation operon negative regulatory protein